MFDKVVDAALSLETIRKERQIKFGTFRWITLVLWFRVQEAITKVWRAK